MDANVFVGRKAELDAIRRGLAPAGEAKAILLTGETGLGKTALLAEGWKVLAESGHPCLWMQPLDLKSGRTPRDVPVALARGLDASPASLRPALSGFAQAFGQAAFEVERLRAKGETAEEDGSPEDNLSRIWLKQLLEAYPSLSEAGPGAPSIIVVLDDFERMPEAIASWLTERILPQWEECGLAKRMRWLFSFGSAPCREPGPN